ncbi:hypothetical protein LX36DRAFT_638473 [Colletotrichum falcatum]|nr:hypothetical protein LX36DRAFT_638473 [Colletotrichum falcatum]
MDDHKERRSTCRHFRQGNCVFWQTPEKCRFPHRPKHAPRVQPLAEYAPHTTPRQRSPSLNLDEASPFMPDHQHHSTRLAANTFTQRPAIHPNSGDGCHEYRGGGSWYLGHRFNNMGPHAHVDSHPCEYLVPSPPGFPFAEPRVLCNSCYPGHGANYYKPGAPFYYAPENAPAYQQPYQHPGWRPHTLAEPPMPPLPHLSTPRLTPPVTDGQAAPPLPGVEQDTLVNPEKLERERSKACWYGDGCKRPNCYYRHDVVEGEVEGGSSGPTSSSSPAPAAEGETGGEKPAGGQEHFNSRCAPLVVNGTNYRRRPKDTAA